MTEPSIDPVENELVVADNQPASPPRAKALSEFTTRVGEDPDELLKDRFLCRGGGLLLIGPSGIGKSSLSMQAMLSWAIGRPLFGICPARPLRILMIQAENDDGDIAEMRDGVVAGLGFTPEQVKNANANIFVCREDVRTGIRFFLEVVEPLIKEYGIDLLLIDPALSYLGADANSQKDVGLFLRNHLNPLLRRYNLGVVLVHHTNKPPQVRNRSDWSSGDFAYLGSGSAEWANWARAVLTIRSLKSHDTFELVAAKRGKRLDWKAPDGVTKSYVKTIEHSNKPGVICWQEASPWKAKVGKHNPTPDDVLVHVPIDESISKEALRDIANSAGIAVNRINGLIIQLVKQGRLYEWRVPRRGTRPEIRFARFQQPNPELSL